MTLDTQAMHCILPLQHATHKLADPSVPHTPENHMALPSKLQPASSIATDSTTQKLADLEARIAKLEGALIISPTGAVTLKSGSNIVLDSSSGVTIKSMAAMMLQASGTLTLKGAAINLN